MVGEYCITLMYLDNHYFDGKFGVVNQASRKRNREERQELELAMNTFIKNEFERDLQQKVILTVEKLFYYYDLGFVLDQEFLSVNHFFQPHFNSPLPKNIQTYAGVGDFVKVLNTSSRLKYPAIRQKGYLEMYLQRSFLINAVFFQVFTELLIDLFGCSPTEKSALLTYAKYYGLAQQLVNDNCDFVPASFDLKTVAKNQEDTFNDLRMRIFTLPLIVLAQKERSERKHEKDIQSILRYYSEGNLNFLYYRARQEKWVLNILVENGALKQSQHMVSKVSQYIKKELNLSSHNPFSKDLQEMLSFTENNRFYKIYNQWGK